MKTLKYRFFLLVFLHPYIMDFWNILQKLKKFKNLTKSALGGVRCLKRKVREAIEIKTLQPTINRDQGFDLPAIYSEILPVSVTRDRSRQTSGHPAQTIGAVASSSPTKKT